MDWVRSSLMARFHRLARDLAIEAMRLIHRSVLLTTGAPLFVVAVRRHALRHRPGYFLTSPTLPVPSSSCRVPLRHTCLLSFCTASHLTRTEKRGKDGNCIANFTHISFRRAAASCLIVALQHVNPTSATSRMWMMVDAVIPFIMFFVAKP